MKTIDVRRWWALGALALAVLAVGLDATVLNIALPTLATDLHASTGQLQWFVDAYSLAFAALILPAGMLGDRLGRKKLLLGALVMFGLGSVACAYSPSADALIASRVLLGVAGAFLLPLSMSVLPVLFSEEERPKAIAIWVAANAISFPIGPILGGWLLTNYWWGSVFLINLPVVALALIAVSALLPESRSSERPGLDLPGVLTSSLGLAGLTYGVIEAGENGWTNPGALAAMAAGLLLLATFAVWQRRTPRPLVDLALFRSASFTWGASLATLVSFAMFGVLFVTPQYFQGVLGTDALGSGFRLLPVIGGLLVGSQLGTRLAAWAGAKITIAVGFIVLAAGLAGGAVTGVSSGYGPASAWISVTGLGLGFSLPTAMDASLSALSPERSGVGSALIQALRLVGGTIGVAILGTVLNSNYRGGVNISGLTPPAADAVRQGIVGGVAVAKRIHSASLLESVRTAFVSGMDAMLWVCAGMAAMGIALTLIFLPGRSDAVLPQDIPGTAGLPDGSVADSATPGLATVAAGVEVGREQEAPA